MWEKAASKLTYANVLSTIAVLSILGTGSAYAAAQIGAGDIKRNAVRSKHVKKNALEGKDVREASLRGIGLGLLGGEWSAVGAGSGGFALSPFGEGVGGLAFAIETPVKFKIVRFRARLLTPQTTGTRTFQARIGSAPSVTHVDLCTISAGQSGCVSQEAVTVPAGTRFDVWVEFSGANPDSAARFGWQAVS
jgi:hypothetical protein